MTLLRRACLALIPLALLAGCAPGGARTSPTPALTPDPTPAATGEVIVHWDMLEEPEAPLMEAWGEGATDILIPSEDYGLLVPYIGREGNSWEGSGNWIYGLATRDGRMVTQAVYLDVRPLSWYDTRTYQSVDLPVYLLLQLGTDGAGEPCIWYGLAAEDGSWYTGQVFTGRACSSQYGVLMTTPEGDGVMIAPDGSQLFRWTAQNCPLPNFLNSPVLYMEAFQVAGPWLVYSEMGVGTGDTLYYADLRTGRAQREEPEDLSSYQTGPQPGVYHFPGGQYSRTDSAVIIRADDGESYTLPCDADDLVKLDGDRALLGMERPEGGDYRLVDMAGNVLSTRPTAFVEQHRAGTPALLADYSYDDGTYTTYTTVLDRDGRSLFTAQGYVGQYGDRLVYADEEYYRLCDLTGEDLLRIPRLGV